MNTIKKIFLPIIIILFFSTGSITAQKQLPNGTKAPEINTIDHFNREIGWKEKLKKGHVVVVFYRGQWCQYCNLYMYHLADSLSMITDLGASLIAVTPENNENIDETVEKTKAHFNIVYDVGHEIMDSYKVTWHVSKFAHIFYKLRGIDLNKASDGTDRALPVPATYIIGQDGRIKAGYFNKNYKLRMPISEIVKELKKL
ncbi:MAG: AhpC/TSA family protein [Bacteroidales bacterium]|nr:AhpC/TSA family protein [Bacteroidales bacterium]